MSSVDSELLKKILLYPAKSFLITSQPGVIEKNRNLVVLFRFPSVFQDHHFAIVTGKTTEPVSTDLLKSKLYGLKGASPNDVMEKVKSILGENKFINADLNNGELRDPSTVQIIISFHVDLDAITNVRTRPYGEKISEWMNGQVPEDAVFTPVESKKDVMVGEENGNI